MNRQNNQDLFFCKVADGLLLKFFDLAPILTLIHQSKLFLLFETAPGYGLFSQTQSEEIGGSIEQVEAAVSKFNIFSQMVKLEAFAPFRSAEDALENINALSEGKKEKIFQCLLDHDFNF